jgi:2-oxoglutarate ferredoxin oxidoreductase subunit beta
MALLLGASFVARGFSGDKKQLVPLIKAAIHHRGAAFIDCISPCVAFNNHPGSTKSFDYVRAHNEAVNALDVMVSREEITADYGAGTVEDVVQHDGSVIRFRKLDEDYDPTDKLGALNHIQERAAAGEVVTGLLYIDESAGDLGERMNIVDRPLNSLGDAELCPGQKAIDRINAELR